MDTAKEENKNNKNTFISKHQALIIAAITIFFYFILSFFKFGYYSYFNIPRDLFSLSTSELFRNIDLILNNNAIRLSLALIIFSIITSSLEGDWDLFIIITPFILSIIYLIQQISIMIEFGFDHKINELINIIVYLLLLYLIFPVFVFKGKGNIIKKFNILRANELDPAFNFTWYAITNISFFITLTFTSFSNAGFTTASRQTEFYIANTVPESVVVSFHEEYALCYPFDRTLKTIENEFFILDTTNNSDIIFSYEEVGPLSFE